MIGAASWVQQFGEALSHVAAFAERFGFHTGQLLLLAVTALVCWAWRGATVPFISLSWGKK